MQKAKEFSARVYEFRFEVASRIVLNEHKGSALRGALFHSLRRAGCSRQELTSCKPCPLVAMCPVSFLLATVDEQGRRGGDVPRPFAINPPVGGKKIFEAGDEFNFGLVLFADSVYFLPYLLVGLQYLEREGLGAKYADERGRWRRGTLRLREIAARNVISGVEQVLFRVGDRAVRVPDTLVTHAQVVEAGGTGDYCKLQFDFHTPTRLVAEGKPLLRPQFEVLVQRLIERVSSLAEEYGAGGMEFDFEGLMGEAREVLVVEDRTRWEEVRGYSNRQHQDLSLSGFVGRVSFAGRVSQLLPLLLWGQLTHVGKDATKGNGWYSLEIYQMEN